jgi:3-phenylpropionate/trans-cinnamate dioxygenase ferredoxin reductase subunit
MTKSYPYVIVGGGMAAQAAIRGIRDRDPHGAIAVLSQDHFPPYARPPLSKALWKGDRLESVWRQWTAVQSGVDLYLDTDVVRLDPAAKTVEDRWGRVWSFGKLLLATGASPRRLPSDVPSLLYFRGLEDYLSLWQAAKSNGTFLIIGGGFIGAELAAALALLEKRVLMVFPETGILARLLPRDLSDNVTAYYREHNVEVLPGTTVEAFEPAGKVIRARLSSGATVDVHHVVAGIGVTPNAALAADAGLSVDDGILVDRQGRTDHPDIFAAGDVARIPAPALGGTLRVEHEDNAVTRGRIAGRNMAGADEATDDLPFFYSDLFDLGFEAVGNLDAGLETVADWVEPYREGVVYYLRDRRVVGVLNWNVWDGVPAARALIQASEPVTPEDLRGRIRNHT